jgi:flavin-dependent dehydrogenase
VDVAVVGGSAAGFFTALLLARGGRRVQVFERARGNDTAPRTLIVTSRMADVLGEVGEKAVVNRIQRFELCANGQVATVALERPDLVVERSILIRALAEQAEAAGVEIVFGRQLVQVAPNGHGLTFVVEAGEQGPSEERWTRTLIGADGAFSAVARAIGSPQPTTVPLLQATVRLPRDLSPDTTRVWFDPADTPYFYWLIPESPTRGALGLIGEEGRQTRQCLERFLTRQGLEPIEFQAARIPAYTGWIPTHHRVGQGDVYLVGDAAAQVKATTVGGIVTGFRGAVSVASAILNGGARQELRALRRELDRHLLLRQILHRFTQADYTRLLDVLDRSTRSLLGVYTRDEIGTLLWRLCARRPRFLLLGLRAFVASVARPRA